MLVRVQLGFFTFSFFLYRYLRVVCLQIFFQLQILQVLEVKNATSLLHRLTLDSGQSQEPGMKAVAREPRSTKKRNFYLTKFKGLCCERIINKRASAQKPRKCKNFDLFIDFKATKNLNFEPFCKILQSS